MKVVDCILALKSFHEFRKACGGNYAPLSRAKTPSVSKSVNRFWSMDASPANPRRLEMTHTANKKQSAQNGKQESRGWCDMMDFRFKSEFICLDDKFGACFVIELALCDTHKKYHLSNAGLFHTL